MNNASRVFIGIFFCFINMTLIQCTSGKKISMEEKEVLVSKIGAEVFENVSFQKVYNNSKTMVLLYSRQSLRSGFANKIHYAVYDFETRNIIEESTFDGGSVVWNDNTSLKIYPYKGIVPRENLENITIQNSEEEYRILILKKSQ